LSQAIYQIIVMCVLMFCGQLIFFEESFNIITELDSPTKDEKVNDRMRLNTMCFHTFMLMNMINLINCRNVSDDHLRIFKTLHLNKLFLATFAMEIGVQCSMVYFGSDLDSTLHVILGTNPMSWAMHITAWVLAVLTIPLHIVVTKFIPADKFKFMLALDLENNEDSANCITARTAKMSDGYNKMVNTSVKNTNSKEDDGEAARKHKIEAERRQSLAYSRANMTSTVGDAF